jgi:hypothetical protein
MQHDSVAISHVWPWLLCTWYLVFAALALAAQSDAYELMLVCRFVELHGGVALRGRRHALVCRLEVVRPQ